MHVQCSRGGGDGNNLCGHSPRAGCFRRHPPACVTASFPTFVLHAISTDMQPNTSTADQHTAKQGASMATPDTATPLTNVDSASLKRVREGSLVCLLAL